MEKIPKPKLKQKNNTGGGSSGSEESKIEFTEEQILTKYVKYSINSLHTLYGIDNLTNTEYLHLRNIAKECIARMKYTKSNTEGMAGNLHRFKVENEIPLVFLQEMYGILDHQIPTKWQVHNWADDSKFLFTNEIDARKKQKEIKEQNRGKFSDSDFRNVVYVTKLLTATDDFKKYLKRLREERLNTVTPWSKTKLSI